MTLKDFLAQTGTSYSAFARSIETSHEAVRRYADECRVPTPDIMRRIISATGGQVQPNDFFDLPEAPSDRVGDA